MYEISPKIIFKGKFMFTPSFLVCTHLMTCLHTHGLEGTLAVVFRQHGKYAEEN